MSREGKQTGGSSIFHISTFAATYLESSHSKLQTQIFKFGLRFFGKEMILGFVFAHSKPRVHARRQQHCLDSFFIVMMVKSTCWELSGNSIN